MKRLLVLSLVLSYATFASADEKAIDGIVDKARADFEVPGAALVIVKDGQIVYLKGHGVRALGREAAVTPDSLFAIASCSKAFCAALIAMQVDEGKMSWDDPVRKHIPFFHLHDPLADRDMAIRDLLCHRTGLSRHDWLRYRAPWSDEEKLKRMAELKPHTPFRTTWEYNNLGFMAAGYASASVAQLPYADLLKTRLFDPLGMKSATGSARAAEKSPDAVAPHIRATSGKVNAIPRYMQEVDGAGGIYASARDLGIWLRFQLGDGTWEGKRLISVKNLKEMHTPQMVMRPKPEDISQMQSYGLAWQVQDYRGRLVWTHGGSIDGFRARVWLLPNEKIGIAVVSNLGGTSFPEAVCNSLTDLLLEMPARDWNGPLLQLQKKQEDENRQAAEKLAAGRQSDVKPTHPLNDFEGTYKSPAYGEAIIALKNGSLTLSWSSYALELEHYKLDTFTIKKAGFDYQAAFAKELITFRLDDAGRIAGMTFLAQDFRREKR